MAARDSRMLYMYNFKRQSLSELSTNSAYFHVVSEKTVA